MIVYIHIQQYVGFMSTLGCITLQRCSKNSKIRRLSHRSLFGQSEFDKLALHVDAFSLMTYDYSNPGRCIHV